MCDVRTGESQKELNANFAYATKHGCRVSWLAQTGFAAFDKGVQLIRNSSNECLLSTSARSKVAQGLTPIFKSSYAKNKNIQLVSKG